MKLLAYIIYLIGLILAGTGSFLVYFHTMKNPVADGMSAGAWILIIFICGLGYGITKEYFDTNET